jgi:hypothetical protein
MTRPDVPEAVREYGRINGRRRWTETGDDPHEIGRLGGKPRKPAKCPKCGAPCLSTRLAGAHCRVKRAAKPS